MDRNASVTKALEGYLIHSAVEDVARKGKLGAGLVQAVLMRQADLSADRNTSDSLETIGIDEIALKKGHGSYVTMASESAGEQAHCSCRD